MSWHPKNILSGMVQKRQNSVSLRGHTWEKLSVVSVRLEPLKGYVTGRVQSKAWIQGLEKSCHLSDWLCQKTSRRYLTLILAWANPFWLRTFRWGHGISLSLRGMSRMNQENLKWPTAFGSFAGHLSILLSREALLINWASYTTMGST